MVNIRFSQINYITLRLNQINLNDMANLNRIKVMLVEHNRTGKWLAQQLGKSPCTVSKWCSNAAQPNLQTLNGIASILNIDVRELLVSSNN